MQEKYIEQKLVATVKSMGGIAPKFVSPGIDGMPDRIVLLHMGRMAFVECKATGKKIFRAPKGMNQEYYNKSKIINFNDGIAKAIKKM